MSESGRSDQHRSAFSVENIHRPPIENIRVLMRLADADHPELAEFRQRPDQMEGDALAGRGMEMQAVDDGDVHQVVWRQAAVALRFEIVRSVVATRLPRWR